jgi:hypothetical protein
MTPDIIRPNAEILISGWHGISKYPVVLVGETPKRYRVKWILDDPFLPLRSGTVRYKGDDFLVPKAAVRVYEKSEVEKE